MCNYINSKIRDSMKYFSEDGNTIPEDIFLRVLKRAHNYKENVLSEKVKSHTNEDGKVSVDDAIEVIESLRSKS